VKDLLLVAESDNKVVDVMAVNWAKEMVELLDLISAAKLARSWVFLEVVYLGTSKVVLWVG